MAQGGYIKRASELFGVRKFICAFLYIDLSMYKLAAINRLEKKRK